MMAITSFSFVVLSLQMLDVLVSNSAELAKRVQNQMFKFASHTTYILSISE